MITDIYIVGNPPDYTLFDDIELKSKPFIHFCDAGSMKERKKAFGLKGSFGAREDPFAIIFDKDKPIKAFYSEAEDVYQSLIKYLHDYERNSENI